MRTVILSLVFQYTVSLSQFPPLLKLFQIHLQRAAVSKITNSTNLTGMAGYIEKIDCRDTSMPGVK